MKTRLPFAALALISAGLAAGPAGAQNLDAHEHGQGALTIVLDGRNLTLELKAPADDITGFEHQPETAEEKAKLESALALLGDPAKLFALPSEAGCAHAGSKIETGLSGDHDDKEKARHGHDGHAKHDDHSDGKKHAEHKEDGHAEFNVYHEFDCASPDRLVFVEVKLFEAFPTFHEIDVQYIVGAKQGGAELEHDRTRIDF